MKFNIENLPDLKIRVNTPEESKRAYAALSVLTNNKAGLSDWQIEKARYWYYEAFQKILTPPNSINFDYEGEIQFGDFISASCEQITLAELEALAAEKQGIKTMENDPTIETVGNCGNCGVEFHIHKETPIEVGNMPSVENEAQKRYDAAEKLLNECGFYASGDYSDVAYKALRIAAGLPTN